MLCPTARTILFGRANQRAAERIISPGGGERLPFSEDALPAAPVQRFVRPR